MSHNMQERRMVKYPIMALRCTLRFLLTVRLSVRDGCGRGHNKFAGRVQKHHVRFSFTYVRSQN